MNIGYARTSLMQINEQNQIKELVKAGVDEHNIFIDKAVSGSVSPMERKDFQRMLGFIREHQVEKVMAFEISRLGRTVEESARLIVDVEKEYNILFWSLSPIEVTFNQIQERGLRFIVFTLFAYGAQLERERLIARTRTSLSGIQDEIIEKGYHITRRGKNAGRRITKLGRPMLNVDVEKVLAYHARGISYGDIAEHLGISKSKARLIVLAAEKGS